MILTGLMMLVWFLEKDSKVIRFISFSQVIIIINIFIMKKGASHHNLNINTNSIILPKLQKVSPIKNRSNSLSNITERGKRNQLLMKQIQPIQKILSDQEESDSEAILRKLHTPTKKSSMAELVVLNLNKQKKQRPRNRFTKQLFVGEEAVQKFYDRYKNIDKFKAINNFSKTEDPLTKIVQLLQMHGFAPRKLDVIKLKGSHAILNLRKLGLGQGKMGPVVTDLMNYISSFQCIDLSYNTIDRTLSQSLIQQMGRVKIINLSHNRIGKVGCDKFTELFFASRTCIEELYLEDNYLLDNAGAALLKNLLDYNNLRVLNLSKNFMGSKFAMAAKQFLSKDQTLEQLYLSWNEMNDKGAKLIFEGIEKNCALKVFDYSWNNIGMFAVDVLLKIIKNNQYLVHLDIAFCEINKKYATVISKALQSNHTIYGFHFEGNSGAIDFRGSLQLSQKQHHEYPLPIVKGLLRKIDSVRPNPVQNQFRQYHLSDICWICDSWQQIYFKLNKPSNDIVQCFLHLQHEKFNAIKMQSSEGMFQTYRMCPLGEIRFFYTLSKGPGNRTHVPGENFPIQAYQKDVKMNLGKIEFQTNLQNINVHQNNYTQDPVDEYYYPTVHCLPRSLEVAVNFKQKQQVKFKQVKKVIVKKKRKVIRQQKLQITFREIDEGDASNFLNNIDDREHDQEYLKSCLQFDIANSKTLKLIKNPADLQAFKDMMMNYYRAFKDTFYYIASSNPSINGIFSISEFEFEKFIEEMKYVTKRVTHAKIILKMYSCLSNADEEGSPEKKKGAESSKLFSRPQFLQFLIRLALQKWCPLVPKSKKKKDEEAKKEEQAKKDEDDEEEVPKKEKIVLPLPLLDGLERTMKTLPKYAQRISPYGWRKYKYLVYDNHVVLKGYETFLMNVFDRYSSSKKKIDKPKKLKGLITLDEIKTLFVEVDIKKTKEAMKDLDKPFLDSVRLPVQDGIIQIGLTYEQFCECLARYSQILWFPPIASQKNELWEFQYNRRSLPLFIKFEALIVNIYRRHLEMQSRRMNKITEKGLFEQETEVLIQRVAQMDIGTRTDLAFKMNRMQQEDQPITLKGLVSTLREKYENVVVRKEEEVESEEQKQIDDD